MSTAPSEHEEKLTRLRAVLDARELDAVVLRSPAALAWWSGGGRTHVLLDQAVGVAAAVVTQDTE